jgi:hypothetical protein
MATAYTSLLGLALPVTGELSGTWGDTVNNSITSLLDSAIAGTTNVSTDVDVTLTTTAGAANTAREAILLFSGARTALRTVTAPAQSKTYIVINATTGGFAVKLVGAGPTTGVTIANGSSTTVAWNGSDFVEVSSPSSIILPNGTANGVLYLNGSKVVTSGSALTFDGTNTLSVSGTAPVIALNGSSNNGFRGVDFQVTGTSYGDVKLNINTGELEIVSGQTGQSGYFQTFKIGGSEQMRLTSTGLGIGTSSPSAKLSVVYTGGNSRISIGDTASSTYSTLLMYGGAGKYNFQLGVQNNVNNAFEITPSTATGGTTFNTPAFVLDSSGNVGIGTSSPAYKLDVAGVGRFVSTNTVFINPNYDTGIAAVQVSNSAGLAFATSNIERARIDSSGNLGLGVTPSAWSAYKAMQFAAQGVSVFGNTSISQAGIGSNGYYNGTNWIYNNSSTAAQYLIEGAAHKWYTAASGTAGNAITFTQAMTLDASGFLGVGETSPTSRIHANGTIQARTGATGIQIYGDGGSGYVNSVGANPLILQVNSTERARIDSSGNLLVGTTSGITSGGVVVQPVSGQSTIYIGHITGTGSGASYSEFYYAGTNIGSITQSGTTAVLFNVTSDQRLKDNIVDAPEFGSVIDSIKVRSYDWKADGTHQRAGFVAQELVTVAPEAVHQPTNTEDMMAVDYSKLVPMLVKEIQSLRKRLADAGI